LVMAKTQSAGNCKWATPTLFLEAPIWLDAESCPWTCTRDRDPRVLGMTITCATCTRWEAPLDAAPANTDGRERTLRAE